MQKTSATLILAFVIFLMGPGLASASSAHIRMLSCSGLGAVNGYVTINLVGRDTVKISSLKYFVTAEDDNVRVVSLQVHRDGYFRLDFYSRKFKSRSYLLLSAPVGPAKFVTDSGTDILTCQSNIEMNL
ncbi:MAG: hypothetical protein ACK5Y2_04870 [Bdellovibrionales bacterium]